MFKTKATKMRKVVEEKIWLIDNQLKTLGENDVTDVVHQTLTAQKVILQEILRSFDKIES